MNSRLHTLAMILACSVGGVSVMAAVPADTQTRAQKEAERIASVVDSGFVMFSCDQMDVRAFVKMVGADTGKKFVVDDNVEGKLTVVSPRVSRKDAFPLFVSILESAGSSVVRDGDIYRVVALPKRSTPLSPVVGATEEAAEPGMITKVFRIQYASVDELRKAIETRVAGGKTGAVVAMRESNHLIVTDTAEGIRRIQKMILEVDQPGLTRVTEVVVLKHAGAEDIAAQLNLAMAENENRAERLKSRLPAVDGATSGASERNAVVVPSPHSNSLILIGTANQLRSLKDIIEKMDVDVSAAKGRLNAIFLRYMSADEAATNITQLLSRPAGREGSRPQEMKIAVAPSAFNNALLVDASPGDFEVVKKLVEQIDLAPQQVHINVLIAEHSLSEDFHWGVEMRALDLPTSDGSTVLQGGTRFNESADTLMNSIQQNIFPKGLTVGVAAGRQSGAGISIGYPGLLNIDALKKTGKFRVRSETSLGTQDNREAMISVVNEIPILKSTIQGGSGTSRDVIQNIDRLDVGIKLRLLPHVVPGGEVQMQLTTSIEAVIDPGPSGTQFTPTIAKREVKTSVMVPDGQQIVIAGLTREDKTQIDKRIPILGYIPILGWLFSYKSDVTENTNVMIFVTPRVISDMSAAARIREEWEQKTNPTGPVQK